MVQIGCRSKGIQSYVIHYMYQTILIVLTCDGT